MNLEEWNKLLFIKEKYEELLEKLENASFVRTSDLMQDDIDLDLYRSYLDYDNNPV